MLTQAELIDAIPRAIASVDLPGWGPKTTGKVRDIYKTDGLRILITTDRISAFDRVLGLIPYKGQVLNQLSAWWFDRTRDIVANHVVAVPDPNVTIGREAVSLPVEVVVRGYITGVTTTSLWYLYSHGDRRPYGIALPEGLRKNDPLPQPIITPTTKAAEGYHDERITREEIIERGIVPLSRWEQVETAACSLFARGQMAAQQAGLILVDTKYEFGIVNDELVLIDEIHTPDSSRYWVADTYGQDRMPANYDKEYLREWFASQGYRGEGTQPHMTPDFIASVAARYIGAYERLTGTAFVPAEQPAAARIERNLARFRKP